MRPPNISKADEAHNKKTKRLKVEIENVGSSSVGCRDVATSSFDFEKRRASFVLNENEIWAVKDEFGMPRRYVFVWRGGDIQSAELHVLRNRDRLRLGGGVPRAWGIFDSGACHEPKDIPTLSHKVEKLKNYNKVLPRTGEVWAIRAGNAETLFGDSSPTLLRYQMVEALTNFVENKGMKLVYLVSVAGVNGNRFRRYQSAFRVQPDYVLERFSHQVPCMRVSGDDLLELDPSSLPLYVDDFETSVAPEINDNYLFLGLLDRMASANREFDDEIWAACDHDCRVPQKYVEIRHERRYQHQHKRRYHKAKHELIPIFTCDNEKKWQEAGLPIACGKFTVANVESERHFILSHRLSTRTRNYERTGDVYDINIDMYPKEGEVWGIYKDRNLVMACNPRGALYYQIVVIVGTTEKDVKVARLSRVEGFKGLFKKSSNLASGVEFLVPVNEFHRFSHTIPSYRFDEKCSKEFFRGAFVLNPFLVPLKHDEPYSFNDPFLAQIPKVQSSWSAIQYFVNKQRKSISMASQANSYEDSENCTLSLSVEQEQIIVENLREGEPNIGEISPAEVHVSERMECEADEHETIHHIKFHDFEDSKSESTLNQVRCGHSAID
ncbi:uncharacterized protein A4U43_C09F14770 [Asparagus officinalis]|uniref:DUF3444 domain-containing protein n=1 Tax=Asparagus officinalis TaxID=4686 RepID=A0A5P1E7R3_ASPOF|nr:uncharacterized protein A4U43_C09F14770 [Asparagus officinalis]